MCWAHEMPAGHAGACLCTQWVSGAAQGWLSEGQWDHCTPGCQLTASCQSLLDQHVDVALECTTPHAGPSI